MRFTTANTSVEMTSGVLVAPVAIRPIISIVISIQETLA